jgi:hypothetical protein
MACAIGRARVCRPLPWAAPNQADPGARLHSASRNLCFAVIAASFGPALAHERARVTSAAGALIRPAPGRTEQEPLQVSDTAPPCGFQMPPNATALMGIDLDSGLAEPPLTQAQQTLILDRIQSGAPNN